VDALEQFVNDQKEELVREDTSGDFTIDISKMLVTGRSLSAG